MARLLSRKFFSLSRCWRNIFHALRKNSPCQTHKRSNNVLASTDLARCHPRVQSHASEGDGPSTVRTGLWSGFWSGSGLGSGRGSGRGSGWGSGRGSGGPGLCQPSCFLSFLSPPSPPVPPGEFHTRSNAITVFDDV